MQAASLIVVKIQLTLGKVEAAAQAPNAPVQQAADFTDR